MLFIFYLVIFYHLINTSLIIMLFHFKYFAFFLIKIDYFMKFNNFDYNYFAKLFYYKHYNNHNIILNFLIRLNIILFLDFFKFEMLD